MIKLLPYTKYILIINTYLTSRVDIHISDKSIDSMIELTTCQQGRATKNILKLDPLWVVDIDTPRVDSTVQFLIQSKYDSVDISFQFWKDKGVLSGTTEHRLNGTKLRFFSGFVLVQTCRYVIRHSLSGSQAVV